MTDDIVNPTLGAPNAVELAEQIVNAIQYPDERVHFIRQALDVIPPGHPRAEEFRADLERVLNHADDVPEADRVADLRGVFGAIPLGADER